MDFEDFWIAYPRRKTTPPIQGKYNCSKKWAILIEEGINPQDIINGAKSYAKSDVVKDGYVKMPMTYLNGRFWLDEEPIDLKTQEEFDRIEAYKTPYQHRTATQWSLIFPVVTEMSLKTWQSHRHGPKPSSPEELMKLCND